MEPEGTLYSFQKSPPLLSLSWARGIQSTASLSYFH